MELLIFRYTYAKTNITYPCPVHVLKNYSLDKSTETSKNSKNCIVIISELRHVYENGAESSNSTHSETSELRHVYENGANSSSSTHSETSELRHVYENGADSSNSTHSETKNEKKDVNNSETSELRHVYENGRDFQAQHHPRDTPESSHEHPRELRIVTRVRERSQFFTLNSL